MNKQKTDLAIIGAGPGGYTAAFHAADRRMKVVLIDTEEKPGGVCLYRGCIPSKVFLHPVELINSTRGAERFGLGFETPVIDFKRIKEWKNEVVGTLTDNLAKTSDRKEITYIQGYARLTGDHSMEISPDIREGQDSTEEQQLEFENAIIATGSRPKPVPGIHIDSERFVTSEQIFDIPDVPETLLVIGGGYIGLEMGTTFSAFGSAVSYVEITDGLLPGADRDLVSRLNRSFKRTAENVYLGTRVTKIHPESEGLRVTMENKDGDTMEHTYEYVLSAVGREPNVRDIGLEHAGVEVGADGFVTVDERRRTTNSSIFAIGDITGQPMLAHKAAYEGKIAVEFMSGEEAVYDPKAIPAVVFTDPEIAWCGISETETRNQNIEHDTVKFPWRASGRALSMGRDDGLTKLIIDPKTKRIIGAGMVGPRAGELIGEVVLAMEMGAVTDDIRLSIHPHPTLSEIIMETAESYGSS